MIDTNREPFKKKLQKTKAKQKKTRHKQKFIQMLTSNNNGQVSNFEHKPSFMSIGTMFIELIEFKKKQKKKNKYYYTV